MERRVEPSRVGDDAGPSASRRCQRARRHDRPRLSRRPVRIWEQLVVRLDAAQVAGLAVRLGPWDHLPAELRAAADSLALPVITFPEGAEVADVTAAVLDALLEAQGRRLEQRARDPSAVHEDRARRRWRGRDRVDLARPVRTVRSRCSTPTAARPSSSPRTPIDRLDVRAADGGAPADSCRGRTSTARSSRSPTAPPSTKTSSYALEQASMAIAVRLAQASAVAEAQERFAAISLEELIAGHAGDAADVAERAISFGWDLGRPRAVLLASIDPPTSTRHPPARPRDDRGGRSSHARSRCDRLDA